MHIKNFKEILDFLYFQSTNLYWNTTHDNCYFFSITVEFGASCIYFDSYWEYTGLIISHNDRN